MLCRDSAGVENAEGSTGAVSGMESPWSWARLEVPRTSWRARVMYAATAIMTKKPMTRIRVCQWRTEWERTGGGGLRKTPMILKTSLTPIGGLSGRRTKAGVKKRLIQRRDQPAWLPRQPRHHERGGAETH